MGSLLAKAVTPPLALTFQIMSILKGFIYTHRLLCVCAHAYQFISLRFCGTIVLVQVQPKRDLIEKKD